jgi:phenylpropionate dioxygenase-like ring-hydroxylating dioxygenase large terminal subunit
MADDMKFLAPGEARCPGPSWDDLAAADSRPMPDFLRDESYRYLGSEPLAAERYVGADFFRREVEKMWPNVWQYAARDEDMPEAGDTVVYENVGRSYLLARQDDGQVRAFHNVCLHRGRKLRTDGGHVRAFRCPYHGFTWGLDGSMTALPCQWDFSHLKMDDMSLPEAQVGRWGGYIFLKEAPGGPSLAEYLDPFPAHFERWRHDLCATTAYVGKVLKANWKAVMEAFMEQWHTTNTHPQIMPFTGDANGRCNIFGDHVNFGIAPMTPSPNLDMTGRDEQWLADYYLGFVGRNRLDTSEPVVVEPGSTARRAVAARARRDYSKLFGVDLDHATDCEFLDSLFYSVFPNFGPWGGFRPSIDYRFRPWPDQDHTLMEVRILTPVPPGQPIPRSVPMRLLGDDEPWTNATEFGVGLGGVLDQDVANVEQVQAGLKVSKTGKLQLGDYMDIRIRHFHQTLDKYLAKV